ncbi:MAG: OmpA family protein [Treponema sp.]|nr:OmpA family protein [Spirochaetia bacterium]MDD7458376.1 OmpA family protein [Spirochaetales bacterium]MDY5812709.1 OmpA family protein [Treponema sp.]
MKNLKRLFFSIFLTLSFCTFAQDYITNGGAIKFTFKYKKGDMYRILSTVDEDIFVNHLPNHHSIIINRVTAEVTDVTPDGSGVHNCVFMTTEDSTGSRTGAKFTYGEDYASIFTRSSRGIYTISDQYFMPTVRNVPVFPDKEVAPGEKWKEEGHEAHDLRRQFNIQKPYKVPFVAEYTYLGIDKLTGLHVINVRYRMEMQTPSVKGMQNDEYILGTKGFSDELIYWDAEKGAIDHYTENFRILIESSLGNLYEFSGSAKAEITDFKRTNTEENLATVQNKINEYGLENVTVKNGEKGLTISLEDIKFQPDSATLMESEKAKLNKIAEILASLPDNDILVTGHTALAGTERMRQVLSEERAGAVAEYLVGLNVRDQYHIFTQGFGAEKPVAPNTTEAGKAKNRRVEITIMDR